MFRVFGVGWDEHGRSPTRFRCAQLAWEARSPDQELHRRPAPTGLSHNCLRKATGGAAKVLGPKHSATKALAKAALPMAKVDLWHARLAVKTLRRDQREAIAAAGEG